MHLEVEQKFRVVSHPDVRTRLEAIGAAPIGSEEQADLYLLHPGRNFAKTDEALRLRRIGEENYITYKGPKLDQTTKTRREIELPLPPGDEAFEKFAELLEALGFGRVATVRKTREKWQLTSHGHVVEIALDKVSGVGNFVELEISADEAGLEAARQTLTEIASELALTEATRRSYLEMWLENLV